jgi:hypothetical protein
MLQKIGITVSLCMLLGKLNAQLVVQQGAMSINSNSVISIDANAAITGKVVNKGTVNLHRNFLTSTSFLSSSGTVNLVGSNQSIQTDVVSVGILAVKGGGTKRISGRLAIQNALAFSNGIVQVDRSSFLTLSPSAQVTGGSPQSYVDGFLYHAGTGSKFYPVGRNGTYAPATLLNVTGNDPVVGLAYFPSPAIDGTPFHWQQQTLSGTYQGSRAELTFTAPNADYAAYRDEVLVLAAERSGADFTSLGQSTLSVQGDRFTISSDQPSALPILTVGFDIPASTRNLYLPNAFSASAPSPEDQCVKVYGQRISPNNFYLAIQDVWGNVMYETRSWAEASTTGWRGPVGSQEVAATYRYLLKGEFIGGKQFQQSGTILHY